MWRYGPGGDESLDRERYTHQPHRVR
jgi:hypothetical protein